jgi:ATP-dependent RNA helicase DDX3X
MAAALPDATVEQPAVEQASEAPAAEKQDPQAWVEPMKYDYATFNKTNKELEESREAQPAESAENAE